MSFHDDYREIVKQIEAEWIKSPLSDATTRRYAVVSLVLTKLGMTRPWHKEIVEAVFDRLFPTEARTPEPEAAEELCPECGLNDGHHYVGCKRSLLRE
jgi:hypothetical protein